MGAQRRQARSEMHSEVLGKPSRPEVTNMMAGKADVSEMDALFERAQQHTHAVRLQVRVTPGPAIVAGQSMRSQSAKKQTSAGDMVGR